MAETTQPKQENWWDAFPAPRAKCGEVTADELYQMFDDMDIKPEPKPFLLIDVRRTDWEGGTIKTSINLPAQSFYQTRKTLLDLCERAGIQKVIFYCGEYNRVADIHQDNVMNITGASNGRGPRCASWMQDYIDDVAKFSHKTKLHVLVLKGGIKGWVKDFEGSMMDGFEEKYWEQFK